MAAKKKPDAPKLTQRMYDVIRAPHVTEKSTLGSEHGQLTFRVPVDADKAEIKRAIEGLWGVNVTKVNTLVQKGKTKRFRGIKGRRSDFKKAVVTLAEGQTIDIGLGV